MRSATGESGADVDLSKIRELEERLDNFRIQVADDMTIRGSAWQGFAHNAYTCDELGQGGTPFPPSPGACCLPDGTCEEVIPSQCGLDGGTFFGGSCTPNPCPQPTGACCVGSDCSITTESDCTGMGGTYQGDGTTCDPNPCEMPPCCPDAFDAFDGSGRKFLKKTIVTTANFSEDSSVGCTPQAISTSDWSSTRTDTIDPDTCETTCECSGSGSLDYNTYSGGCVPFHDSASLTSSGCVGFDYCEANFGRIGYETISGCEVSGSLRPEAHGGCRGDVGSVTTVNSATSETIIYDAGSGVSFFHGTVNITLSNECTP